MSDPNQFPPPPQWNAPPVGPGAFGMPSGPPGKIRSTGTCILLFLVTCGMTGLWYFPGMIILVGPFIWFVKTNAALNEHWASQGAQPA